MNGLGRCIINLQSMHLDEQGTKCHQTSCAATINIVINNISQVDVGVLLYAHLCTDTVCLHLSCGHLFQHIEQSRTCSTIHTHHMLREHCRLLGAAWPGPTLAPALSNTRCRSLSASGGGGCCACVCVRREAAMFCVHTCMCVCTWGRGWRVIVVDEFIIKDIAPSALSPLLSHYIVTNRPHEA